MNRRRPTTKISCAGKMRRDRLNQSEIRGGEVLCDGRFRLLFLKSRTIAQGTMFASAVQTFPNLSPIPMKDVDVNAYGRPQKSHFHRSVDLQVYGSVPTECTPIIVDKYPRLSS